MHWVVAMSTGLSKTLASSLAFLCGWMAPASLARSSVVSLFSNTRRRLARAACLEAEIGGVAWPLGPASRGIMFARLGLLFYHRPLALLVSFGSLSPSKCRCQRADAYVTIAAPQPTRRKQTLPALKEKGEVVFLERILPETGGNAVT